MYIYDYIRTKTNVRLTLESTFPLHKTFCDTVHAPAKSDILWDGKVDSRDIVWHTLPYFKIIPTRHQFGHGCSSITGDLNIIYIKLYN